MFIEAFVTSVVIIIVLSLACVTLYLKWREALSYAVRDELTGLLDRRGFRISLEPVFGSFERGTVNSISVVHVDLNDFKPVNDQLGHHAGDEVLQVFARILSETTRSTDIVARMGGDEFIIVLPDIEEKNVYKIITRAKKQLKNHRYSFSEKPEYQKINLSFSYGVHVYTDTKTPFTEVLKSAERRCEANKKRDEKGR